MFAEAWNKGVTVEYAASGFKSCVVILSILISFQNATRKVHVHSKVTHVGITRNGKSNKTVPESQNHGDAAITAYRQKTFWSCHHHSQYLANNEKGNRVITSVHISKIYQKLSDRKTAVSGRNEGYTKNLNKRAMVQMTCGGSCTEHKYQIL
jgi:hypothetical protein